MNEFGECVNCTYGRKNDYSFLKNPEKYYTTCLLWPEHKNFEKGHGCYQFKKKEGE